MIGFKVNNELYDIHELSGSRANTIACLNSPRTIWSNVVYQLRKLNMIIMYTMCHVFVLWLLFRFARADIPTS